MLPNSVQIELCEGFSGGDQTEGSCSSQAVTSDKTATHYGSGMRGDVVDGGG